MLTTSLSIGATLACLAFVLDAAPFLRPHVAAPPEARGQSQAHIANQDTPMDATLWTVGWPHEAPDHTPSVPEAHHIMQRHCSCLCEECPRKQAAFQALVEAGHIKPDVSRTR